MNLDKKSIQKIKNYFKDKPVIRAYLFGSYVRGEANDKSDIDILVELDYSFKIGLQFVKMKMDLDQILKQEVDLVTNKSVSKYIKPIIDSEKKVNLYPIN